MGSERAAGCLIWSIFLWRCLGLVLVMGAISPVFREGGSIDWWEVAKTAGIAGVWFQGWDPYNLLRVANLINKLTT